MTNLEREAIELQRRADPQCADCQGDGIMAIERFGSPDRGEDVACDCTKVARDEEEI